jgi:hypothetical protein
LDADAIGGSVNLTLRQAPEGFHFDLSANGGYNQLGKDWKNYKFTGSLSDRFFDNALGARSSSAWSKNSSRRNNSAGATAPRNRIPAPANFYINTESAVLTVNQQTRNRNGASAIFDYSSDLVDLLLLQPVEREER